MRHIGVLSSVGADDSGEKARLAAFQYELQAAGLRPLPQQSRQPRRHRSHPPICAVIEGPGFFIALTQSLHSPLNRTGESSVYRTVCRMSLWPR
jgi:hypothetical protein